MATAADEEIVARALDDAGRHAIDGWDDIDDYRTRWISESGIDFVNAADGNA
jgi:hypothetical protein